MIKLAVKTVFRFVFFILLQVWVLNNIHLFRIVEPFLYLYIIVKFPVRTSRTQVILLSFLSGLTIDLFTNTPGMHAAACSLIGFMRRPLVRAFADRELEENTIPSYYTFGTGAFMRYVVALTVIHHLMLFLIESVSLFDPAFLFLRISASVVLTSLCIFVVESFNVSRKRGEF